MSIVISGTTGILIGIVVGGVLAMGWVQRHACPDPDAHSLTQEDRDEISAEFVAHAVSVRRELSRYADALADGDTQLRERLRQVEAGAHS